MNSVRMPIIIRMAQKMIALTLALLLLHTHACAEEVSTITAKIAQKNTHEATVRALHAKESITLPIVDAKNSTSDNALIVMIGSYGGYEAAQNIISGLPTRHPPIIILEHLAPPQSFINAFPNRVIDAWRTTSRTFHPVFGGTLSSFRLNKGSILIVGNGRLQKDANGFSFDNHYYSIGDGINLWGDKLLYGLAEIAAEDSIGIILPGNGIDGARGVERLNAIGATTISVYTRARKSNSTMPQHAHSTHLLPAYAIADLLMATLFQKPIPYSNAHTDRRIYHAA